MKLKKEDLEKVRFQSRGHWYNAQQVDAFLDELAVAADGAERELGETRKHLQALTQQVEELLEENRQLRKQMEAPALTPSPQPAVFRRQDLKLRLPEVEEEEKQKLKEERSQLIQDIKALRSFRETFRKAVQEDAAALETQIRRLESDHLLEGSSPHE